MVAVFLDAHRDDTSVQLMYSEEEIWSILVDLTETCIRSGSFRMMISKDPNNGAVIGWMSLGLIPSGEYEQPSEMAAYMDWSIVATQVLVHRDTNDPSKQEDKDKDNRRNLQHLIHALQDQAFVTQAALLPGMRLVVNALVVNPDYQRQGYASLFLRHATMTAQHFRWSVWAQVPASRQKLFARRGFAQAGSFELSLDRYAPSVEEESLVEKESRLEEESRVEEESRIEEGSRVEEESQNWVMRIWNMVTSVVPFSSQRTEENVPAAAEPVEPVEPAEPAEVWGKQTWKQMVLWVAPTETIAPAA